MNHILTQADIGKFLEDIGVLRPLQYAVQMDVDRSPVDLAFLISRWSSYSHTFVLRGGEITCGPAQDNDEGKIRLEQWDLSLVTDLLHQGSRSEQ